MASADAVEIDGIYYYLSSSSEIKIASVASNSKKYSGNIVIPESVTYKGETYSVVSIGDGAFSNCSGLTSVTIPNSVTSIDRSAFYYCTGLTSVTIPNSVTSINSCSFFYCYRLTSLIIPQSVVSISSDAFSACYGLTSISVESGNPEYDSRDNSNAIIETKTNTLILGCRKTVIPNSVTSIGSYAFYYCTKLTSITLPNSVTSIGSYAFYYCTGLTSITIPNGVTSINGDAFHGCSGLTSVTLPSSVSYIYGSAFRSCTKLASISVDRGNPTYDSRDNCNAIIETNSNTLILGCKNTIIPNSVTSIGQYAFSKCSGLSSIILSNSISSIGNYAFNGCSGLTTLRIPNSVTSIGGKAFCECSGLTDVYCYTDNVPIVNSEELFSNSEKLILHVPAGSVEIYKRVSPWSNFKNIVSLDDSEMITLRNDWKIISDGDPFTMNAKEFAIENAYPESGLLLFVNNGSNYSKTAKLEIQSNTLNAGNLRWSIGNTINDIDDLSEKSFSTDENGYAMIRLIAEQTPTEGNLQAKLTITVGEKSKSYYLNARPFSDNEIPLTFEAVSGKIVVSIYNGFCSYFPLIQYRVEGGPWNNFTLSNNDCYGPSCWNDLPEGRIVQIRGIMNGWHHRDDTFKFKCDTDYYIYGNVMSANKGEYYLIDNTSAWLCYYFENDTHLRNHPVKDIVLPPAKEFYYEGMFKGCTGLTRAPKLSATELTEGCYKRMFEGCTALTTAPELPATDLNVKQCYYEMFKGCSNLNSVTCMATSITGEDATKDWLSGVNETGLFKKAASMTNWTRGASGIPLNWNVEAPNDFSLNFMGQILKDGATLLINAEGWSALGSIYTSSDDNTKNGLFVFVNKGGQIKGNYSLEILNNTLNGDLKWSMGGETYALNEVTKLEKTFSTDENGVASIRICAESIPTEGSLSAKLTITIGEKTKTLFLRADFNTASITIGKSGKASYCGDQSLDFSFSDEVKAYIATGFDRDEGTIWLTRVKDVPAGTPVLIKGEAENTYQVPVTDTKNSYYENLFKGNTSGATIQVNETDGDMVNYYLSGDGTFKSVKGYANIGNNKSYLQLPGTFAPAEAGTTQTVTIKTSGKASFAAPVDLDFTNVDGLKAFTATGYDKSSKTIWLTRVMKVQKGEGVLLKGDAKDYEIPSVAVQSSYMNMFVGNTSGASVQVQATSADGSKTNYYLAGDGTFKSVNGYVNINDKKCYLALPTSMVAVASTRSAEDNYKLDEPEMISMPIVRSIESDNDGTTNLTPALSEGEGVYYNLQGQRVAKPGKGLYIRNGEKVVIK